MVEDEERFHQNLEIWARSHPKEALLLPYIDDSDLSFCLTEKGESNLCRQVDGKAEAYHSQMGALQEAENWFSTFDQSHVGVLYIYGIGLGYYYFAAKEWLHADKKRSIVFLEDDLAVMRKFFTTKMAEQMLQDSQVRIIYLNEAAVKKVILADIYWHVALMEARMCALKYYKESKKNTFEALSHEIDYSTELKKALLDEYLEYGGAFYKNFYQNMIYLPYAYQGNLLFGKFKKIPAIICGAGPSLEKNMHFLKQVQERALIFAGGSAINVLNSASIQPHLCAGIDPNEAQNVRLHNSQSYEVPFFYRNRLNHNAFKSIHGPHLYLTGGGGYDVSKFFESKLHIEGEDIEEGENIITFCIEIAQAMNCDPIILVGVDLAFTDRKTYSGGVVFDPNVEQKTLDIYANFETTGLLKKDIYGEPIYTLWKWIAESEWIGQWAKDHPKTRIFNCTEGGLGCPGVKNVPLKKVAKSYLQKQYDLRGRIHAEIQNAHMPDITFETIQEMMLELKSSLVRCEENYKTLIEEAEKAQEKNSQGSTQEPPLQSWRAALAEIDLADECAFPAVLSIFNQVSTYLFHSEFQQIKYDKTLSNELQRQIKQAELNCERFKFLSEVSRINADLIDYALEEYGNRVKAVGKPVREAGPKFKKEELVSKLEWGTNVDQSASRECIYYECGALKGECHFKNGLLHGPSIYYTKHGSLLAKADFVEGIQAGECSWYYLSGALYSKQHFLNGVLEGEQIYFYEDGLVKTVVHYQKGCLVDTGCLYGLEGNPERIIDFNKES